MKFDRMGRRVEYVDTVNGSTNAHHRFVYDGYICIQRFNAASRNAIDLVISWDPSEPVATRPLILQKYGQYNLFYTHDGNKNVSELVFLQQANGIAAHYEYAPFGAVTTTSRSTPVTAYDFCEYNPFRFSSEYAEGVLRLVYYNYRHYTSIYGRWIVRDPVEDYTKDAAYSYCNNIPTTLFDVLGLRTKIVNGVIFCRTSRPREGYAPTVNGCGSGWNTYLVPDRDYSIIGYLFDVDFKVACNKHDACYGTCAENKATCDTNLYNGMIQECDKIPNLFFTEKARCYAMAKIFYFAVDKLGDGPFESAQDDACEWECCGMINYGRQDFINAYPEF